MNIINANIFVNGLIKNQQSLISLEQSLYKYPINLLRETNAVTFIEQYFISLQIYLVICRSCPDLFCK